MLDEQKMASLQRQSPFFELLGFENDEGEDGKIRILLDIKEQHMNKNQTLHGGVHAAMLDNIFGTVIYHHTYVPSTTITLNVHYLAPVKEGRVTAVANILHLGYKSATVEGLISDEEGKAIAKGTGTFKLLREG
ncbi:acyl-CoA thioesterase [Geomicrobium halophilum]|uniref:Acyl-CoA thioesterase n=1 Tax=Geomicrobium halophilum TaxID=549000 RepID=A0A841Q0D0_9BACL|nr:PaaI family thioesterase [Geomicrobium halophilum]MBB6450872.1 acyl-CoA thioesterase [Geomicrobium halophilum]